MMKIVIALDRSRQARAVVQFLRQLRWPTGSAFTFLHVLEILTIPGGWQLHYHPEVWKPLTTERRKFSQEAQRFLERLGAQLRPSDGRFSVTVKHGPPAAGIVDTLRKEKAALVVVGSRGLSGVKRFLLGSVSESVLHSAPCSVLIVRGRRRGAPQELERSLRVLLAVDESEYAVAAARRFRALRVPPASQVTILHVVEPPSDRVPQLLTTTAPKFREAAQALIRVTKERGKQALDRVRKVVTHRGLTIRSVLVEGRPAEEIIRAAERMHADLVVLGSRGMTGLRGTFLGSVSRRVARHAPCSVLVVKER